MKNFIARSFLALAVCSAVLVLLIRPRETEPAAPAAPVPR